MRDQLIKLRRAMEEKGIDAYLVPTTDFHGSEYVNDYFTCRKFLSGFTGSAGTLLVLKDWAGLWTDGRYFLQAETQLAGSGIQLMKEREEGVPDIMQFLEAHLPAGSCLGFDGRVLNCKEAESYEENYLLRWNADLTDEVWEDRPALSASRIYPLSLKVTGEEASSKLKRVRCAMEENGADMHLITRLEEIAWLYNLRGNDVSHTPVFFAFAIIEKERDRLYVLDNEFSADRAAGSLPQTTEILPYFQFFDDLKALPQGTMMLNRQTASYTAVKSLPGHVKIVDKADPAELMKAVKNETEIRCTRNAHVKDGAAMVNFIFWLKSCMAEKKEAVTEISASDYAEKCRREQNGFRDLSFTTITGYGSNAAMCHYSPTIETNRTVEPKGFFLIDSGGHYTDGTTDITRTIAAGPLTNTMKENYTLVLKSHIALETAQFVEGTTGAQLDELTRRPMREKGLDYNHGTGHGVGHLLSVHEGPQSISFRGKDTPLMAGMICSDEPGLYLDGEYGIRLENEILCKKENEGCLGFEPLTWCPWEREAILPEMLTPEELQWVNDYHRKVRELLSPLLEPDVRAWLDEQTQAL